MEALELYLTTERVQMEAQELPPAMKGDQTATKGDEMEAQELPLITKRV